MLLPIGEKLDNILELIAENKTPTVSVRELLKWVLAERRGSVVVFLIRENLKRRNLITTPDFESAYLDSEIEFVFHDYTTVVADGLVNVISQIDEAEVPAPADSVITIAARYSSIEPAYKISRLESANKIPIYIAPDSPLEYAVTLMMANGFSQIPVMTSDREVKGIISWTSIGSRMALGKHSSLVRDYMEPHQEMRADGSILSAINIVSQYDYVLIRQDDKRISGIVTASDLNFQFKQISEAFMLLSEIENYIRRLIEPKFNSEQLSLAKDPGDEQRVIESVSDLTFGEYVRLLEHPDRWNMLGLAISRKVFCEKIDQTRKIRNDVMHFDPDGIPAEDLKALHEFSIFLQRLQSLNLL